jgi:tetratricopeptide (TPR) repeat protein
MSQRHSPTLSLCFLLFLSLRPLLHAAEPIEARLLDEWKDPDFIKSFTGDLGVRTDIEPSISAEEKALIASILPQITQNQAQAFSSLSAKVTIHSSAALDFLLGHLSNVSGNREQAARHYNVATDKFPNFLRAHKWLGHFYFEQQDFVQATQSYGRVLSLNGGDEFVHGRLAYCLLSRGEYVSAETAFRNASVTNPSNPRWKVGLAHCYLNLGRSEAALAITEELLRQEPDTQSHWLLKANAHLAADESRKALAALEAARRVGRATAEILISIGDLYLNEGLIVSAIENYQAALSENPNAAEVGTLRAIEALLVRNQLAAARTVLGSYNELSSTQATEAIKERREKLRLWINLSTDDSTDAVSDMESYLTNHPLDIDSLVRLADHFQASDHSVKAEQLYLQALRIDDTNAAILVKIAQLQAQQRRYAEALSTVQKAIRLSNDPNLESYAQQLDLLAKQDANKIPSPSAR